MKNIILLLTLITTINLTANSFSQMRSNVQQAKLESSQKFFYAKRAAERGNARAQFDLGLMYANGNGVAKNEAEALKWFSKAAQNNFYKPVSVKRVVKRKKISQQFIFAKNAAAKGNVRAQFDLAMMYSKGNGVRKNEKLAFNYFHKAARNNSIEAKFQMGLNFAQGRGVKKQKQLAKYWFKLAAKAGHSRAMAHLASLEKSDKAVYGRTSRVVSLSQSSAIRTF